MAFDKYKDGAWMEPEDSVRKNVDGAWGDCDAAKRVIDGAWSEVWANIKIMTELSNELAKGILQIIDDGKTFNFWKIKDTAYNYGDQTGGGTIVFYLDGEWTNPSISFDWEGGFIYKASADATTWIRVSSGDISLYSRTTDGTVATTKVVNAVGSTVTGASFVDDETGSYNGTLNGTFNRLGISINIHSFSGSFYNSCMTMILTNLLFDGRKIGFPADSAFDLQEWPS